MMFKKAILTMLVSLLAVGLYVKQPATAQCSFDYGIYTADLNYLDEQIAQKPDDAINYLRKASFYLEFNQVEKASELYKKALTLAKEGAQKDYINAMILFTDKKFDDSKAILEKLVKQNPKDVSSLYSLGLIALESNDETDAKEYFQKITEIDANNLEAMNRLGWIAISEGEYDKAILYFNQVLYRNPSHVGALEGKGYSLYRLGLTKEATSYINSSIILMPTNWGAWVTRGNIYLTLDKRKEARYSLQKAEVINPDAEEVKELRMKLYPCPIKSTAKDDKEPQKVQESESAPE